MIGHACFFVSAEETDEKSDDEGYLLYVALHGDDDRLRMDLLGYGRRAGVFLATFSRLRLRGDAGSEARNDRGHRLYLVGRDRYARICRFFRGFVLVADARIRRRIYPRCLCYGRMRTLLRRGSSNGRTKESLLVSRGRHVCGDLALLCVRYGVVFGVRRNTGTDVFLDRGALSLRVALSSLRFGEDSVCGGADGTLERAILGRKKGLRAFIFLNTIDKSGKIM